MRKIGEANYKAGIFQEYFGSKKFSFQQEVDRIDFIITDNIDRHLIWAETKKNTADITEMFVQLILTIGKARTFDRINPPPFLCVFDYFKIAFLQITQIKNFRKYSRKGAKLSYENLSHNIWISLIRKSLK